MYVLYVEKWLTCLNDNDNPLFTCYALCDNTFVFVTNLGQEEGGAVVKVHVALTVKAAPAIFQHVVHTKHVHRFVVLQKKVGENDLNYAVT